MQSSAASKARRPRRVVEQGKPKAVHPQQHPPLQPQKGTRDYVARKHCGRCTAVALVWGMVPLGTGHAHDQKPRGLHGRPQQPVSRRPQVKWSRTMIKARNTTFTTHGGSPDGTSNPVITRLGSATGVTEIYTKWRNMQTGSPRLNLCRRDCGTRRNVPFRGRKARKHATLELVKFQSII
jgi:hypothetical protein